MRALRTAARGAVSVNGSAAAEKAAYFVTGGSLPAESDCYVEREADGQLFGELLAGQFCYVLESRQVGKSSLMVRTAARLRGEGRTVALVDLTAAGTSVSVDQWYAGLLFSLAPQLPCEDALEQYWLAHSALGPAQRWFSTLADVALADESRRLVVFVDEIDATQSLPFATDEFFAGIRECHNRRARDPAFSRLTFCLLGVASPGDLIRNKAATPFNIGTRVELSDFMTEEARPLARHLIGDVNGSLSHVAERMLARVLHWTNGHPYLTQRLCRAAAAAGASRPADVDAACRATFLDRAAQDTDDNLTFVRNRLLEPREGSPPSEAVLDTYMRVSAGREAVPNRSADPVAAALRLSGIVRVESGVLRVRNRVYERVFDRRWALANLPGAEVERQRRAARKGFLRASALSALVLAVTAGFLAQTLFTLRTSTRMLATSAESFSRVPGQEIQAARSADAAVRASRTAWMRPPPAAIGTAARLVVGACRVSVLAAPGEDVASARFLPDGRLLTASRDGVLRLGLPTDWRHALVVRGAGVALADCVVDHGTLYAVAANGLVREINSADPRKRLDWTGPGQNALAVCTAGPLPQLAATTGTNADVLITRRGSAKPLRLVGHTQAPSAAAFTPDGRTLVTASPDGTLREWDTTTGRALRTDPNGGLAPSRIVIDPEGRIALVGDADGSAAARELGTGRNLTGSKADAGPVAAVDVVRGAALFVTAHRSGAVMLWPGKPGDIPLATIRCGGQPRSVALSPDGRDMAVGLANGTVEIWRFPVRFEPEAADPPLPAEDARPPACVSPDGRLRAQAAADGRVTIEGDDGSIVLQLHSEPIWDLRFSADSAWILTRSQDRTRRRCPATVQGILGRLKAEG